MKKTSKMFVAVLSALMVGGSLAACGNNGGNTPTPPGPVETDYKVSVTCPTGISASSDKERAKKGEEVTITITHIDTGYQVNKVTLNSSTELSESEPNVYKFTMPNQSASVVITASVSGAVTLIGDSPAVLTKNEDTGVYELKNFLVTNGSKETSQMSFKVNDTVLPSTDFNTYKSFGDITLCGSKDYSIEVATNCYYDFYYDPSIDDEGTCYIQRSGVEVLPTDADSLSSLLVTSWGPGSEYCYNVEDLLSAHVEIINVDGSETTDYINQKYDWKKYLDNKTFAVCVDKDQMEEETNKYVYKALDEDNKVVSVVDTYDLKNGNLKANDDPTRESYNNYGAYSAKYDVVNGDDYDVRRYSRNNSHAQNIVDTTAHAPVTYIEKEFQDAYRVGVEVGDDVNYSDVQISSVRNQDDSFVTTIKTVLEFDHEASTYVTKKHYALQCNATLTFSKKGALTNLVYKKTQFQIYSSSTLDEWDTTTHQPKAGCKGAVKKKINATYTYGEASEELTDAYMLSKGFTLSDYFLASVESLQIFNTVTKEDPSKGESVVHLGDDIMLLNTSCNLDSKVVDFKYSPSTALDLWEYGVTSSNNEAVIKKEANDNYTSVSAVGKGTSKVTFTNHHSNAAKGIEFSLDIKVVCVTKVRGFYLTPVDDPYDAITSATPVTVKSGFVGEYTVHPYPSSAPAAPCEYHAVSSNNTVASVTSADNATVLTIKFGSVVEQTKVTITFQADYDPDYGGGAATVFTFYVIANDTDPTGTWAMSGYESEAQITFNDEYVPGSTEWKTGSLFDDYTDGTHTMNTVATFQYKFDGISLVGKITSITITGYGADEWSTSPSDYVLEFQYDAAKKMYGIGLAECAYDEYYESKVYYAIWGEVDLYEGFVNYSGFAKVSE